jgi:putative transposase
MIATLPSTSRGTALVSPGHGVKINYIFYWADAMEDPKIQRQQVPVRFDPFDLGTAYAFIGGRWAECHSDHYRAFQGRSQKELVIASKELHTQNRERNRNYQITASKLAQAFQSANLQEVLLLQRMRALESQATRERTQPTHAGEVDIQPPSPEAPPIDPTIADGRTFESF